MTFNPSPNCSKMLPLPSHASVPEAKARQNMQLQIGFCGSFQHAWETFPVAWSLALDDFGEGSIVLV